MRLTFYFGLHRFMLLCKKVTKQIYNNTYEKCGIKVQFFQLVSLNFHWMWTLHETLKLREINTSIAQFCCDDSNPYENTILRSSLTKKKTCQESFVCTAQLDKLHENKGRNLKGGGAYTTSLSFKSRRPPIGGEAADKTPGVGDAHICWIMRYPAFRF